MTQRRVTRAIVLAAGMGSRLRGGDQTPKPLREVAGVPLLVRVLRTLQTQGIREAVIVTGYQGDQVRTALVSEPSIAMKLRFVQNDRYEAKNGVSLLAAADYVDGECLLTMSDHLYSPELVRRLLAADVPEDACALAVDYDIERCFDLEDATKVRVGNQHIVSIDKELESYHALDTGVFRITPALIRELEALDAENGDCSLSEGVLALAARGEFLVADVGDARWIDVDTPAAMERAEAMVRVWGDMLGDEPGAGAPAVIDPETIENFAPSWVRATRPYNEDHFAVADGHDDVLRMMSNESPFAPSPRVLNAILTAALQGNRYPTSGADLKQALAERDGLHAGHVILGAGSTELIDVIVRTFVGPGEEVLLSVPTFSMYETRTRAVGGTPVMVAMNGEAEHDIEALLGAVNERTKVIFICTPNNPTGNRIPEDQLRRILRLGLPTVIDEAYVELGEGASYVPLLAEFANAMVLRTFSKAFGLAGMRLGYAMAHPTVVKLLSRVKVPWNIPAVTIAAELAALEDVAEFDARMRELNDGRELLEQEVGLLPGFRTVSGDGNFVLVDISDSGLDAQRIVDRMLASGVLIRSLSSHHVQRSYVRITVGTREQNVRTINALRAAVRAERGPALTPTGRLPAVVPAYLTGDAE